MPPIVNRLARTLGYVWLGFVTFLVFPPKGTAVLVVQIVGYTVLGLGIAAWMAIEVLSARGAERIPAWGLPWSLGVVAAAAGAACTSGNGSTALVIFTAVAAMYVGGELDLSAALAVTSTGVLAIEVSGLIFSDSYGTLIGFPAIVLAGLVIGRNRGAYRIQAEQAAALLAQRQQLQAEQRRADLLDERARIAREIHDVLAHSLGALGIQVQAARSMLRKDIDQADELLIAAQRMAAEGLVETRRAVHALRAGTLPLNEELAGVTDTYAQRYRVAVSFETGGVPAAMPPDATVALLRITQEALVNAAKHASGQPVQVRLDYGDADVRLTVRNDLLPGAGPGQPPGVTTVNGGYGLTGMHERLKLLNGTLEAGRRDGQWIVTAGLPRPAAPATPGADNMAS
ncbi:MAG TPA: histidine kinase [Streptosporangiaceae bacterium]|jgi:signal transduction histidine kinase|nr:histidine kinase [Streptosporangiaceae bacterium]